MSDIGILEFNNLIDSLYQDEYSVDYIDPMFKDVTKSMTLEDIDFTKIREDTQLRFINISNIVNNSDDKYIVGERLLGSLPVQDLIKYELQHFILLKDEVKFLENRGLKVNYYDPSGKEVSIKYPLCIDQLIDRELLLMSKIKAMRGKLKMRFGSLHYNYRFPLINDEALLNSLQNLTYKVDPYDKLIVNDSKKRYIDAPTFKDKVVQHMINILLREYFEKKFIFDSYACIRKKGTHRAVLQIQTYFRRAMKRYQEPCLVKLDISKFFYTIDKHILLNTLMKYIKCPKLLYILRTLIFSYNMRFEKGLPLGSLTSQLFANIILNEFDHWVKDRMGVKYYVRYADDMFFIIEGKQNALRFASDARAWLQFNTSLELNPKKSRVEHLYENSSIVGLGFNIYLNYITPIHKNKSKFVSYVKNKKLDSMQSWYGYASISQCHEFIHRSLKEYWPEVEFVEGKFIYKRRLTC